MEFTNLKLEKSNLIGTLTLNRPEKLNAMSPPLNRGVRRGNRGDPKGSGD